MSGDQVNPAPASAAPTAPASAAALLVEDATVAPVPPSPANWTSWSNLWQVPTMVFSAGAIAWALNFGAKPDAPNDFEGALTQVEQLTASGKADDLELAATQLQQAIEPHLDHATVPQNARFHAAVADYLWMQQDPNADRAAVNRRVAESYSHAADLGLTLAPNRQERWAEALLAAGQIAEARKRLKELDKIADDASVEPALAADCRAVRNRVFRRLVETVLRQPEVSFDEVMTMIADYRLNRAIAIEDELWAIARQTEMRLQSGEGAARQAVDLLLVELRRLENRGLIDKPEAAIGVGELYVLLGRGYFELGEYARAQGHLRYALTFFAGPETARGEALMLLGKIDIATGNLDTALDQLQIVVRDFIATPSYLPGLLGLAEAQGMLGAYDDSVQSYRMLCESMRKAQNAREATPMRVASSLCDRYDAVLALGKLDRALDYGAMAENLFPGEQVPAEVLLRLATVHRQLADDMISHATPPAAAGEELTKIDPAVRHAANVHYEKAGDYYLRHANAAKSPAATQADEGSASQWLAAESFDLGGRQDLAIEHFTKYLDMHAIADPRRPQTLFRLAQAHAALLDHDKSIERLTRLIADHPRSTYAAQAFVPLARACVAMNRVSEAREKLQQVLAGTQLVNPSADDYRDALLELGRIEHQSNSYMPAVESFNEFLQRYPGDERLFEVRYLLGDSYRANALLVAERVRQDAGMSLAESGRLKTLSEDQLEIARDLFGQVANASQAPGQTPRPTNQDMVRRAALYQADCSFHLEDYEQAIQLYDHAARQYSAHQSSMYALIQVVNCYSAMSDADRAAAAHQRALARLKQLPDDVFAAPDSLMDRAAWEQWLENTPVGLARTASAANSDG